MGTDARDELHWLAFRWVAGELSVAESAAFEARLAHDQAAREAVASSVEMMAAVGSVPPVVLAAAPRRAVWRGLGFAASAACLAVAAGLAWGLFQHRDPVPPDPTLALAWSGLHEQAAADPGGDDDLIAWLEEPAGPAEIDWHAAGDASAAIGEVSPPRWLLEAASLRHGANQSAHDWKEN